MMTTVGNAKPLGIAVDKQKVPDGFGNGAKGVDWGGRFWLDGHLESKGFAGRNAIVSSIITVRICEPRFS